MHGHCASTMWISLSPCICCGHRYHATKPHSLSAESIAQMGLNSIVGVLHGTVFCLVFCGPKPGTARSTAHEKGVPAQQPSARWYLELAGSLPSPWFTPTKGAPFCVRQVWIPSMRLGITVFLCCRLVRAVIWAIDVPATKTCADVKRGDAASTGGTGCNWLSGNTYTIICNNGPTTQCTMEHEAIHRRDLEASGCCIGYASCISNFGQPYCYYMTRTWRTGYLNVTECNAHTGEISCLNSLQTCYGCTVTSVLPVCRRIEQETSSHKNSAAIHCGNANKYPVSGCPTDAMGFPVGGKGYETPA